MIAATNLATLKTIEKAKKTLRQVEKIESMKLKSTDDIDTNCQICVTGDEKLGCGTDNNISHSAKTRIRHQDLKGAVVNFIFYLQQQEKAETTLRTVRLQPRLSNRSTEQISLIQ